MRVIWILCLLLAADSALARVIANIDRAIIDANESFNLSVVVDNMQSDEPDVSPLADDFEILGVQESNNTRIYNGQISQQRLYTYQLMPKREGVLAIPPIAVGGERSQALSITVRAADTTNAAGRDIFIEVGVDRAESWVQAQVILSIRVYRAALVRQERLREPTYEGIEVLVQPLGDDRAFSKQIDGRTYDVFERRYALYPQASGTLEIGEFVFSGRIWQRSRLSSRRLFRSEPLTVNILPIPAPPAAFPDADWLPASTVELSQRWHPGSGPVVAGEPVTRELTLAVTGLMASQLPPLAPTIDAGLRVYPDKPELETGQAEGGLVGVRTERFAVIAADDGEYAIPAVQIPWWNVDEARWDVAELPATRLAVVPGAGHAEPLLATLPAGAAAVDDATWRRELRVWQWLAAGTGAAWLATALAWFLLARRKPRANRARNDDPTSLGARRRLLRAAGKAARQEDYAATARHLRDWAAVEFGGGPWPLSAIAAKLPAPAAAALHALNASLYGRPAAAPSGAELAAAIATLSKLPPAAARRSTDGELAPLSPLAVRRQ